MKKGKLIIYSGPSGVGKGTVKEQFIKNKELNIHFSISATSRIIREGEQDGREYYFLSLDTFKNWIKQDKFIEWAEYVGNYYGTPKKYVEEQLSSGNNVLLEIEIDGANQVIEKYPKAIKIFLVPPNMEELENRLKSRLTETESNLKKRINKAKIELEYKKLFDHVIVNDEVDQTVKEITELLKGELN